MNIKMITRENVPCWYELSWRDEKIILRIHKDFVAKTRNIPQNAPRVEQFKTDFGFKEFGSDFSRDMGFENTLKFLGEKNGFLEYRIPTPLCKKDAGICKNCNGTGKDEVFNQECPSCSGRGREIIYDYQEAYAVSASLTTFFRLMQFPEFETSSTFPQLLCVRTITIRDIHGGALGGEYSRELVKYLCSRPIGEIPEMVSAMLGAYKQMEGGRIPGFYKFYFSAYTQGNDGWLNVICPGDATGLNPDSGYIDSGRGYRFSCHNTDTPMQQLTLLASLAALHDLARA